MLATSSMMDATRKAFNSSFYPSLPPAFPNNPPISPAVFLPLLAGTESDHMFQNNFPPQAILTSYQDFNNNFMYSNPNAAAACEEDKVFSSCQHSNISNDIVNFNSQDYQN